MLIRLTRHVAPHSAGATLKVADARARSLIRQGRAVPHQPDDAGKLPECGMGESVIQAGEAPASVKRAAVRKRSGGA